MYNKIPFIYTINALFLFGIFWYFTVIALGIFMPYLSSVLLQESHLRLPIELTIKGV